MNRYRSTPAAWYGKMGKLGGAAGLWTSFTQFTSRQPELVIAGAVIGGALLGYWVKRASVQSDGLARRLNSQEHERHPMPSARLGATEDQMSDDFAKPSERALEAGSGGTTGAIYDLDPDSLTSG